MLLLSTAVYTLQLQLQSVHGRFCMLHATFIFVRISQSCVMCFVAVVHQHVWQDFIQTPAQKKSVIFLKSETLVPSTSSWAVPCDKEGRKILFHKVICYKSSRKRQL